MTEIESVDQLRQALDIASERQLPVLILGGGSNLLISDKGWPGLVVKMRILGISPETADTSDAVRLVCGGGEAWDDLVKYSVDQGLQGIECLSGIPGTVGASPIQNIGAYGQEVKETIAWVEAFDRISGDVRCFQNQDCGFAYRWSRFKGEDNGRYVVTRVAFDLSSSRTPSLRYGDLTKYFEASGNGNPGVAEVRDAVLEVRRSKGMVVDPQIPDSRSCGSFFMNPIVEISKAAHVKSVAVADGLLKPGEKMPEFEAGEGTVKLSAAWLMERAGLKKGEALGNIGLSTRHVLAVVNRGGGSSAEVEAMVRHVRQKVLDKFTVELHPEPVFVGFEQSEANLIGPQS